MKRSITSVLAQTYPVLEIIVVDDGSTDDTSRVVEDIDSSKIRYLYKANGGGASALNNGIRSAGGNWIALLDSDDLWRADKLEKQVAIIKSNPAVEFVHSNRRLCWANGHADDGRLDVGSTEGTDKEFLFSTGQLKHQPFCFAKDCWTEPAIHFVKT